MNAALLAACGVASRNAMRGHAEPVCYIPLRDLYRTPEHSYIGMIKIESNPSLAVLPDLQHDGCELRFRNVCEVNELIRKLEALRENMMVLEGE